MVLTTSPVERNTSTDKGKFGSRILGFVGEMNPVSAEIGRRTATNVKWKVPLVYFSVAASESPHAPNGLYVIMGELSGTARVLSALYLRTALVEYKLVKLICGIVGIKKDAGECR